MNANSRDEDGDDIRPCLKYRLHFKFAKKKLCKPAQPERLHLYHSYIVIIAYHLWWKMMSLDIALAE